MNTPVATVNFTGNYETCSFTTPGIFCKTIELDV
jgi:hypothetical protein